MTTTTSAFSRRETSAECASEVVSQVLAKIPVGPNALIVFASPKLDLKELLTRLNEELRPQILMGCSSAGEFAAQEHGEESVSVLAIQSNEMDFHTCVGTGIREDANQAASDFVRCLKSNESGQRYRYILLLTDALAGHTEEFLSQVNEATAGSYQLFGGGAGDDARFQSTYVFNGAEILQDAAVGLAIFSDKKFGIGVRHGWVPASEGMRATETDGFELISLNAEPALAVLMRHAKETGQTLDVGSPVPFFLQNVLGVASAPGHKIRVPLGITERGGIICATEIPMGATVQIMKSDDDSAVHAASVATGTAMDQIGDEEAAGVIFFDCVATRLRLGAHFAVELGAVRDKTAPAAFVGCNSYGQVARVDGQFSGFHNCTAVVCVIPS